MLFHIIRNRLYKNPTDRWVLYISVVDLINASLVFVQTIYAIADKSLNKGGCTFVGFILQMGGSSVDYLILVICLDTYLMITSGMIANPSFIRTYEIVVVVILVVVAFLTALIPLLVVGYAPMVFGCWYDHLLLRIILNIVPRFVIWFIIIFLYSSISRFLYHNFSLVSMRSVSKTKSNSSVESEFSCTSSEAPTLEHTSSSSQIEVRNPEIQTEEMESGTKRVLDRNEKKAIMKMILFPTAYVLLWFIPNITRLLEFGGLRVLVLTVIVAAILPIQGFVNAIVYGWIRKVNSRKE